MAYGTDPDPYGAIPPYQVRRGRWSDARRQPTSRDAGIPGINNTVATGAVDGCLAREPYVIGQGGRDLTSRPGRSLQQTPTSGLVSPT